MIVGVSVSSPSRPATRQRAVAFAATQKDAEREIRVVPFMGYDDRSLPIEQGLNPVEEFVGDNRFESGAFGFYVYRSEKDPNEVLWLMEWESHEAFNKSGDESGEEFNSLVTPAGEWQDDVWHLSDAASIE